MRSAPATWFTRSFALILALFLSAIVAAGAEMAEDRLKNEKAYEQETQQRPSEIESKAIVYVYRNPEFYGSARKPAFSSDGIQLAKIANGRYFIAKLDPGPHVFRSKGKQSVIEMDLVGGKTYYIRVAMQDWGRTRLFVTDSVEAAHAIGTLELLQAKYILEPGLLLDPNDPYLGGVKVGSIVPGEALGGPLLQRDTENQIFFFDDTLFPGCDTRRIVNTEVKEVSEDSQYVSGRRVAGNWKERWYMDRCGEVIPYDVRYVPDGKGGSYIHTGISEASEDMEPSQTGGNAASEPPTEDPYSRGVAYDQAGEHKKAVAEFTKAIALEPNRSSPWHGRAVAYINLGEPFKAIEDLDEAVRLEPDYFLVYFTRGTVYAMLAKAGTFSKRMRELAMHDLDKSIELSSEFPRAYQTRGALHHDMGQNEEACQNWRRACELGLSQGCTTVEKEC